MMKLTTAKRRVCKGGVLVRAAVAPRRVLSCCLHATLCRQEHGLSRDRQPSAEKVLRSEDDADHSNHRAEQHEERRGERQATSGRNLSPS